MRKAAAGILFIFIFAMGTFAQTAQPGNTFHFLLNAKEMGTEQYELIKTADGYRLTGKLMMKVPVPAELAHEETLSPDLGLQRYKLTVSAGAQVIEAWPEGGKIQMKAAAGGQEKTNAVNATGQVVVLDNMIIGHFQVLLDMVAAKSPAGAWTFVVPQVLAAIPGKISLAGEDAAVLDGKPVRTQKYTVQVANVLEELWAEAGTNRLMRVTVPVQKAEFVREGFALAPKPEPKKEISSTFVERDVQFPSGGFSFPATLCLPAKASGKIPLLVLVHGSGSIAGDRDATIGPNKIFRDLAHGLAASGIATLRYDKRTYAFGRSLDAKTLTIDGETIDDAVAALQFARTLPEADPQRLFVLGHSQGATFAPFIAQRAQVRGAILMSAAERPLDEVIPEQVAFNQKLSGQSEQEIATQVEALNKAFARVRSGEAKDDEIVFHAPAHYWRDYLSRDPQAALRNLKAPVLVLQGGKDVQVRKPDYDLALKALAGKPPELREAHFFPDLNHLFLRVEGEPTGAEYGRAGTIPEEVIQTIATWVKKR